MSNNETNAATHYTDFFKKWQGAGMLKLLGPKPTVDQLATVHGLGARPGKQAFAIAMSLRDCGVTGGQIVIACGAPQLNKMRGYVIDALLRELPAPMFEGQKVYKHEVTPKGRQRIERFVKAQAAATAAGDVEQPKAPAKAKAKKRTSAPRKPGNGKAKHVTPVPANELDGGGNTAPANVTGNDGASHHETDLPENKL